jgi:hypothetical protein
VKANGEEAGLTQRTLRVLVKLYSDWGKPAQAAAYTARLKPAAPAKP